MDFNIVIVDDDAVVLFLHKILIEKSCLPSTTCSFKNGKEALDYIQKNTSTKPALVLLDINMPVMNGWEFLDEIRDLNEGKEVYVAMLTSSINSIDVNNAQKYPQVIEYLEKPLTKKTCDELFQKMRILLSEK